MTCFCLCSNCMWDAMLGKCMVCVLHMHLVSSCPPFFLRCEWFWMRVPCLHCKIMFRVTQLNHTVSGLVLTGQLLISFQLVYKGSSVQVNWITHIDYTLSSNCDNASDICKCLSDNICQVNNFLLCLAICLWSLNPNCFRAAVTHFIATSMLTIVA